MYDINTITQGTDFTLRVRAKRLGYNNYVKVSFEEIANIQVNLVSLPNQKTPLSYSFDETGRLIIPVDGQSLDCNTYGLEITGFYNNGNWRQMIAPVVEIVHFSENENYPEVQTDEITIDLDVTLGETYVSSRAFAKTVTELEKAETAKEYTNDQVHEHNVDGSAHTDIREAIQGQRTKIENRITDVVVVRRDGSETSMSEYDDQGNKVVKLPQDSMGKVDGVSVNGEELEVDENGKVDITIPESVHDLDPEDEYATKSEAQAMVDEAKVTGASVDYQEDGGSPSATVDFSEGSLGFKLKNMKMKFSELSPEEVAAITGPQGIPGDNCIPLEGESPLAQVLSQATDKAITPKAVQDSLLTLWQSKTYKIINDLILDNAPHVGDIGNYSSGSASLNFKLIYTPVNQGDLIKISADVVGPFSVAISSDVPANGISATRLYYISHNGTDPAVSLERILEMPSSGYLGVVAKVPSNIYIPTLQVAEKCTNTALRADENTLIKDAVEMEGNELAFVLNSLGSFSDVSGNTSNLSRGKIFRITPGKRYALSSTNGGVAGILKTGTISAGPANFSESYPSRFGLSGSNYIFQAPADAHFVYLLTKKSNGDATGANISEAEFANDVAKTARDGGVYLRNLHLEDIAIEQIMIPSGGSVWSTPASANAGSKTIPVKSGCTYSIYAKRATTMSVLKSGTPRTRYSSIKYSSSYPGRFDVAADTWKTITIPSDAHALNIYAAAANEDKCVEIYEHTSINDVSLRISDDTEIANKLLKVIAESIGNPLTPLVYAIDENGEEIPTSKEIIYLQKKAKQITSLKWTPCNTVPKNIGNENFSANVEVTGMPYSSVKEIDKYIGLDVSIHTFMTAVNNPYSLLYTENVRADRQKSSWGRIYHGTNCGPYFGVVCSVVTGVCSGRHHQWNTIEFEWCAKKKFNVVAINKQSAKGLKIGDIYWKSGHVRLVVSLKRDESGEITHVLISEAGARMAQQNNWITADAFNAQMANENGIIYRNLELYKNEYHKSVFVPVDDEEAEPFVYNDDICTFGGDKASYREGEIVVINYNLKNDDESWQSIEVLKDGAQYNIYRLSEIDMASLPESQRYHALKLEGLTYGKYKARLIGDTRVSDWTEWEVIQTDVTVVRNGRVHEIKWESSNGTPEAWIVCDITGTRYASDIVSPDQKAKKSVDIDIERYVREQRHEYVETDVYLKVLFRGEHGRVTNEPIMITE